MHGERAQRPHDVTGMLDRDIWAQVPVLCQHPDEPPLSGESLRGAAVEVDQREPSSSEPYNLVARAACP